MLTAGNNNNTKYNEITAKSIIEKVMNIGRNFQPILKIFRVNSQGYQELKIRSQG